MSSKISSSVVPPKILKEKEFTIRNSPLIDKYEISDIKTIYNFFAIILFSLFLNSVITDYFKNGQFNFGLKYVIIGFNKFYFVAFLWICFCLVTYLVFVLFNIWAKIRTKISPKSVQIWDRICLVSYIFFLLTAFYVVPTIVRYFGFNPGSASVLLLEELRLLMKQYSFIRTNAPKVLRHKVHSDETLNLPTFRQFSYFLFAPTFLYRDEYPRTKEIRWGFFARNVFEIFAIILLLGLAIESMLIPPVQDFGLRTYSKGEILLLIVGNTFPGLLFFLGGFYSVLHSCQNAFAELLRFGDRQFYLDWWTCNTLAEFYRTFNIVVHDWLHTFIYKDMYLNVVPGNKTVAKITVFIVSALVHEWVIMHVFNFFLPVMFIQFFIAGAFLSIFNILNLNLGNLVVWYCLILGVGMEANMYTLEFCARTNCPANVTTTGGGNQYLQFSDITPRFLTCNSIS